MRAANLLNICRRVMISSPIETRMFEHVFGEGCPFDDLLNKGTISLEWVNTYLELLKEAKQTWMHQAHWPRQLVTAVHMATWILHNRYSAWSNLEQGKRNSTTEELLNKLRSQSHMFLDAPAIERGRLGA
jgi:hypothetical protein